MNILKGLRRKEPLHPAARNGQMNGISGGGEVRNHANRGGGKHVDVYEHEAAIQALLEELEAQKEATAKAEERAMFAERRAEAAEQQLAQARAGGAPSPWRSVATDLAASLGFVSLAAAGAVPWLFICLLTSVLKSRVPPVAAEEQR